MPRKAIKVLPIMLPMGIMPVAERKDGKTVWLSPEETEKRIEEIENNSQYA